MVEIEADLLERLTEVRCSTGDRAHAHNLIRDAREAAGR
jgi:hypothetical protein